MALEYREEEYRVYAVNERGDVVAEAVFPALDDGMVELSRTAVDPSLRGQGVAGRLMEMAAVALRARGWKVKPTCSYAVKWFSEHPEQIDLLAEESV